MLVGNRQAKTEPSLEDYIALHNAHEDVVNKLYLANIKIDKLEAENAELKRVLEDELDYRPDC